MHIIENDGPAISRTNYWDSAHAARGYAFLSWNAGAGRVLLPDALAPALPDMRAARYVIVSLGPWLEQGAREAWELLFEDGSDAPYCLHLVAEQSDRRLPDTDQGGGFVITVWTRDGEQLRLPARFRKVTEIPCLDPWAEQ
ncbi:hypothetical protein V8U11_08180 [Pseudomonas chlororaphis]|uniref:hypothetical protein n=1 Tax=Pseudomonas chlororaphis TaxID=587753 RepID=UPI0030CA6B01